MSETIRAFIAIDIKKSEIIDKMLKVQEELLSTGGDIKLVEKENLHITLWFLGEISSQMIRKIIENTNKISFEPFKLTISKIGYFPGGNRINVIWAGIKNGSYDLRKIFYQLSEILNPLGFKLEEREFTPHVTLCRVKSSRNKDRLLDKIKELSNIEFGVEEVSEIFIKKSTLTPKGPIYSNIHAIQGRKI
ncbi:MAG: RNA 2',3'-cyclic phosphodiesterase [Nitrososphaerota archaeon]